MTWSYCIVRSQTLELCSISNGEVSQINDSGSITAWPLPTQLSTQRFPRQKDINGSNNSQLTDRLPSSMSCY
jgi:hypothetical protein